MNELTEWEQVDRSHSWDTERNASYCGSNGYAHKFVLRRNDVVAIRELHDYRCCHP